VVQDLEGAATLAVASGHLFSGKDAIAEARPLVLEGAKVEAKLGHKYVSS